MTIAIALQRIADARESNAMELDLSGLGLTEIPKEVFSLSKLSSLEISNNQITKLPVKIIELNNLDEIWVGGNEINYVSIKILKSLSGLQILF